MRSLVRGLRIVLLVAGRVAPTADNVLGLLALPLVIALRALLTPVLARRHTGSFLVLTHLASLWGRGCPVKGALTET